MYNEDSNKSDINGENNNLNYSKPKGNSGLALGLIIAGFIPIIGIITLITGIILAHKARKINKDDGVALAALIIGYILISFIILIILIVVSQVGFKLYQEEWFQSYQSELLK